MKQALLLVLLLSSAAFAQRTLSVSGTATIMVKPDYATFTVNIDKMIPATEKWNEPATADQFVNALVSAGIPPMDIEILERLPNMNPDPTMFLTPPPPAPEPEVVYEPEEVTPMPKKGDRKKKKVVEESVPPPPPSPEPPMDLVPEPVMKGVRTTYRVKVQNLTMLPDAISIAKDMAMYLPEARYDVKDRNPLKAQALREAIENARIKAVVLAEKMGGTLGEIISIDDSESGSFFSSIIDIARMFTSGKLDGGIINLPEIATVKVTYAIK